MSANQNSPNVCLLGVHKPPLSLYGLTPCMVMRLLKERIWEFGLELENLRFGLDLSILQIFCSHLFISWQTVAFKSPESVETDLGADTRGGTFINVCRNKGYYVL